MVEAAREGRDVKDVGQGVFGTRSTFKNPQRHVECTSVSRPHSYQLVTLPCPTSNLSCHRFSHNTKKLLVTLVPQLSAKLAQWKNDRDCNPHRLASLRDDIAFSRKLNAALFSAYTNASSSLDLHLSPHWSLAEPQLQRIEAKLKEPDKSCDFLDTRNMRARFVPGQFRSLIDQVISKVKDCLAGLHTLAEPLISDLPSSPGQPSTPQPDEYGFRIVNNVPFNPPDVLLDCAALPNCLSHSSAATQYIISLHSHCQVGSANRQI